MRKTTSVNVFDKDLKIEAFYLNGYLPPFPPHFHDYFVIGLISKGKRLMKCAAQEYLLEPGNMILLNPQDIHSCQALNNEPMVYLCLNIEKGRMEDWIREIFGSNSEFCFEEKVVDIPALSQLFLKLHRLILDEESSMEKEELLVLLIESLMKTEEQSPETELSSYHSEILKVCEYLEANSSQKIVMDDLCKITGLSKSTLFREFVKEKSITPYRYLETIRIRKAKLLLEKGVAPVQTALETGFSDQSHFSNSFSRYIGIPPKTFQENYLNEK